MTSTSAPRKIPGTIASASDAATLTVLRESLGEEVLRQILKECLGDINANCERLQVAARRAKWPAAADIAADIADQSANLGFRTLTGAARSFAAATDAKLDVHTLRNGAQMIVFEYERLRLAIAVEYPDLLV